MSGKLRFFDQVNHHFDCAAKLTKQDPELPVSVARPMRVRVWRAPRRGLARACAVVLGLGLSLSGVAQPPDAQPTPRPPAEQDQKPDPKQDPDLTSQQAAVKSLAEGILSKRDEVRAAAQEAKDAQQAGDDARRSSAHARQRAAEAALAQLQRHFESVAAEEDVEGFLTIESKPFNLLDETVTTLRPLIQQLKDATAGPRELSNLESQIELFTRRRDVAQRAMQKVDERLRDPTFQAWADDLAAARRAWEGRLREARAQLTVAQQQHAQRLGEQRPLWELVTEATNTFVRTRGLNLVIALGAVAAVLFGMRFLHRLFRRVRPAKRGEMTLYSRFGTVAWRILTAVLAVVALLLAFYSVSDWLLLLLTLVFLAGLGWTSLRMAPQFYEEMRLMLNLGSVREGERLVLNGIPWRVERLRLYTDLVNPKLTGGLLRLPIRDLIGLHSRPVGADEVWFPTSRGDWVIFKDGVRAQVVMQSPDLVQLQMHGGAQITCRTEEFIGMAVYNLSNDFRVSATFGVDYAHQAISTTQIPMLMETVLRREISAIAGDDNLVGLKVEFKEAAASSLDYAVLVDLRGAVARDYDRLQRAISRVLVDTCNEQGWVIPFTQVTLHQAVPTA